MKIGVDIRTLMDKRYSGISEYAYNLIKAILKLDASEDKLFASDEYRLFYNSFRPRPELMQVWAKNNTKVIQWRWPNKVLNYLFFKCFNYPHIDQCLGVDVLFAPHINFFGMSGKTKSILTIHDLSFLRHPEYFSLRKNFWHKMVNVKKLAKQFDLIIAVSENTKNDLVELCGVAPEKIKVILSGVESVYQRMDKNSADSISVKKKYNLPDKFILFLGTIEPRKNIKGLISAYNQLRKKSDSFAEYKLVIAGGRGWKSEPVYKEWESSEYRNDINFLGYVEKEDKVFIYNSASLFVYPSFYEGFGFPPLEAMACGIPVITSFTSSLPEVVGAAGLMVDPYNISDLAVAMEKVLINNELRDNLIKQGLERAKNFSWDKTAREYLEVFRN